MFQWEHWLVNPILHTILAIDCSKCYIVDKHKYNSSLNFFLTVCSLPNTHGLNDVAAKFIHERNSFYKQLCFFYLDWGLKNLVQYFPLITIWFNLLIYSITTALAVITSCVLSYRHDMMSCFGVFLKWHNNWNIWSVNKK